jgi:hypothetical protein
MQYLARFIVLALVSCVSYYWAVLQLARQLDKSFLRLTNWLLLLLLLLAHRDFAIFNA